jgi:hypothetical protein
VSGHSTSKPQQSWPDPITPANDDDDESGSDDSNASDQIILKLEEDEAGWPILPAMGKHSLEQLKRIIRQYVAKSYRKPPSTRMEMHLLTLRPCPECYCDNKKARVRWKEMAKDPQAYFNAEDQPEDVTLEEPSRLQKQQVMALWDFWTSRQKDGQVGLVFSGCDKRDKGKRMASDSPSSSTIVIPRRKGKGKGEGEGSSKGEKGKGRAKAKAKGKGKANSADQNDDDPTQGPGADEAEQHQDERNASHDHDRQVLHLPVAPASAGHSKQDRLNFLAGLSKRKNYQDMVQWLDTNLVLDCPLS